ncbi:MAG TPA: TRAP transporter large permease [Burkholderiaceae bacterium]|nr:TRAP transporter large permease [Burkholderiaceae bacterium]
MELVLLVAALVVLIIFGAPMGVTMAILPTIYILITGELPLSSVPYQMYEAISHQPLLAVPFFILTAELMNSGGITERLLALARELVGRVRGGLAQMNVLGSMMFAAMNGSAVADVAAIGGVMIPAMKKAGYPGPFAAAITAIGSTIGGILPPSILLVLLASTMGLSIGSLFAAGIIPGILVGALLMVQIYLYAVRRGWGRYEIPFTFAALWQSLLGAWVALLIPAVIIGGIVFGVFTATEAGAIAVLVAFAGGAFVYRTLKPRVLSAALFRSVKVTSSVFIIIAASGPFSWLLNRIGALQGLEGFLLQFASNPVLFAVVMVLFILLVGTLLEPVPCVIVLGPTLVKVCVAAGFHEVQAALFLSVGFIMGSVSPPVGVCYFTAAAIAGEKIEKVARAILPFLLVEIAVMFLILTAPAITLTVPRLLGLVK